MNSGILFNLSSLVNYYFIPSCFSNSEKKNFRANLVYLLSIPFCYAIGLFECSKCVRGRRRVICDSGIVSVLCCLNYTGYRTNELLSPLAVF